ncbi:facilitated trehalose transporter Tret1-like [Chironomus tepperi]|uniref:facilitated trehalose transporter Tret1-like n=1 Tax=Chironomus tepperi TaxID=113505 RepID=UPI00391F75B8
MVRSSFLEVLPQVLAVSVKNIVLIGFGMTLGFPTVLISSLKNHDDDLENDGLSLNKEQISWISSLNLICVPLGCIFSGSFATFIGRRRAMQLVNVPIFISWIIFFYSQHVYQLYIALAISGITGGMLEAPVLTYVAEITVPKIRGLLAASGSTCIILGIFSQFIMITFLNWRIITLVSSAVPILAIILLFFVPESPHWLIMKKRDEEAKISIMWLRGWETSFDNVRKEYEDLHENLTIVRNEKPSFKSNLQEFGRRTFILPYAICSLSFFIGHFSGMTTLQTYSVIIFTDLNAPMDKRLATSILGALEFIGTLICVVFVNFVGKRKLAFVSTIGCGVCFLLTAIYSIVIKHIEVPTSNSFNLTNLELENATAFHESLLESEILIQNETMLGLDQDSTIDGCNQYYWIPLTLLLLSALLSHSGIRLLPWILVGEIYPAKIRGVSSGLSGGTGYIFGFLANKLFLSMITWFTLSGTFIIYSCVSFVGCAILFFFLPETENRTLQEIEDHFAGKKKLSRRLIKRSTTIPDTFPKDFNVKNWESNEKFEKYLEQVKHQKKNHQRVVKTKAEIIKCNECDYDTRL